MNRHKHMILAAAAASALTIASAGAENGVMNDLEIAHAAYTAGEIDVRYAHLALAISENVSVREFAGTMIRDHTAVNEAALVLVEKLDVTPQDNDLSRALVDTATEKRTELKNLEGKAFDCAYAQNELAYHRLVNETVEGHFIPSATVPELKALLSEALATFKVHEGHAEHMVAALGCRA